MNIALPPRKPEKGTAPIPAKPAPLKLLFTLLLATAAGALAHHLHLPLPWMIGPLFAVAAGCMAGLPLQALPGGRQIGQWAIGTALGLYFSPSVVAQLGANLPLVVGAALASLLLGMLCALVMRRFGRVNSATAFFASLPGGASEMTNLAEGWGGEVDRIATAHAMRVMLVASIVPFALTFAGAHGTDPYIPLVSEVNWARFPLLVLSGLAGTATFALLKIPNPWILGPLLGVGLATALNLSLSALPGWVVSGGQILIGCSLGVRFSPAFFKAAPHFMAVAAASALLGLALAFLLALTLYVLSNQQLATLALATAPGGVAEMCITAKVLQLGVPLITACHVLRVMVLTVGAPWAYSLFLRRDG